MSATPAAREGGDQCAVRPAQIYRLLRLFACQQSVKQACGETVAAAALRETLEEACARIELGDMYTVISVPHIHQVHVIYRARLLDLDFAPGAETLELRLFREDEIPWDEIAFRTIAISLKHFFADRRAGQYTFHTEDLTAPPPR